MSAAKFVRYHRPGAFRVQVEGGFEVRLEGGEVLGRSRFPNGAWKAAAQAIAARLPVRSENVLGDDGEGR